MSTLRGKVEGLSKFEVSNLEFGFDPGDSRTYGALWVNAEVAGLGRFEFEGLVDQAGDVDFNVCQLDGEELDDEVDELPDFSPPHHSQGKRKVETFKKNAKKELQGALVEWLENLKKSFASVKKT
jgi:hypothetical protein